MTRADFLSSTAIGLMTGGLDVWPSPTPSPVPGGGPVGAIRVLVAADRGSETPQILDAQTFAFAGQRWRGRPATMPLPGGREGVVATLDLDQYLYGVVPLEASPGWPGSALQAQAIVARTYALARRSLSRPYDVLASDSDQRYGGIDAEAPSTTAAVDATRGATLTYLGGAVSVFYASCCGGHTADAAEIWGRNPLPYLRGVADPHCTPAPDYRWRRSVALDRVATALGGRAPGAIMGFALGEADGAGRPRTIEVLGQGGRATLTPIEFRRLVGSDLVRSTWIRTLRIDGTQAAPQLVIEGSGRGHGVGFCQWGARYMGADGTAAADILAFYFPGTVVTRG